MGYTDVICNMVGVHLVNILDNRWWIDVLMEIISALYRKLKFILFRMYHCLGLILIIGVISFLISKVEIWYIKFIKDINNAHSIIRVHHFSLGFIWAHWGKKTHPKSYILKIKEYYNCISIWQFVGTRNRWGKPHWNFND